MGYPACVCMQGLGLSFWSQDGHSGRRMEWTLASTANLILDGIPRIRDGAPAMIDLACATLLKLVESVILPQGWSLASGVYWLYIESSILSVHLLSHCSEIP